jgi:zinc/manganese transport system permease protein
VTTTFDWNLINDIRDMWSLPFMVNAFRAGTIVAVLAAPVGWFMVLRAQTFAGHTLAVVGLPGASAAVWLGVWSLAGYFAFGVVAALVLAALPATANRGNSNESAAVGTVQAFSLAAGMLFITLYGGFSGATNALLFGTFLGINSAQVAVLAGCAVAVLTVLAVIGRPLLFASIDPDVASARGVPTRGLSVAFLLLLALTTAQVSQITGALLIFALLVLPAATAQRLTARPAHGLVLAVAFGLAVIWVSLFAAYYSPYPIGFWTTTIGFVLYATASGVRPLADRLLPRRLDPLQAPA